MLKDQVKITGKVRVVVRDGFTGIIISDHTINNLVVSVGKALITSRMLSAADDVISHMALGTGSAAPDAADTELAAEVGGSRVALDSASQTTVTTTDDAVEYIATFGAGVGTGAIEEMGLFNASSGGTMLSRVLYTVNKTPTTVLEVTWTIKIS